MFLQTLPLNEDSIELELLKLNTDTMSKTFSMPKSAILLAGSMMWRIENKIKLNPSQDGTYLLKDDYDYDRYIKTSLGPVLYSKTSEKYVEIGRASCRERV